MEDPRKYDPAPQKKLEPIQAKLGQSSIDITPFDRILVLYRNKDKREGIWLPISFVRGNVIPKTLVLVKPADLKDVTYPKPLTGYNPNQTILAADTPLDRSDILVLYPSNDRFYEKLEHRLNALLKVDQLDQEEAGKILLELLSRVVHSRATYGKTETKSKPGGSFNEAYDPAVEKLVDVNLDQVESEINAKLAQGFKELQYDLFTPLDLNFNKLSSFANIINLLTFFYLEEIRKVEVILEPRLTALQEKLLKAFKPYLEEIDKKKGSSDYNEREFLGEIKRLRSNKKINLEKLLRPYKMKSLSKYRQALAPFSTEMKALRKAETKLQFTRAKIFRPEEGNFSFKRNDYTSAKYVTLWMILNQAIISPDLCGLVKYLYLIENQNLLKSAANQGVAEYHKEYQEDYVSSLEALKLLANEETRQVLSPESEIDGNENFVFSIDNQAAWCQYPIKDLIVLEPYKDFNEPRSRRSKPTAKSKVKPKKSKPVTDWIQHVTNLTFQLINYYSDNILKNLDLSDTVVTGSIIPATLGTLLESSRYHRGKYDRNPTRPSSTVLAQVPFGLIISNLLFEPIDVFEERIQQLYSAEYSVPDNLEVYRQITAQGNARLRKDILSSLGFAKKVKMGYIDGADLDLAVLSETEEEFDTIAKRHFRAIRKLFLESEMKKIQKIKSYLWEISGPPRTVQIYRSNLKQILTHHLAMVRGFIFGNGQERMMYCSASCLVSLHTRESPNYYYFAGIKSPAEIILKYQQRGYAVKLPRNIRQLIQLYAENEPRWQNKIGQIYNEAVEQFKSREKQFKAGKERDYKYYDYDFEEARHFLRKLFDLYLDSNHYSALLGWGNFNDNFLTREYEKFLEEAEFPYSDLSSAKTKIELEERLPDAPSTSRLRAVDSSDEELEEMLERTRVDPLFQRGI
jgi:hypothetical protein